MPKIKKVAVEAAKMLFNKIKKEALEKLLKLTFAINNSNPEESKEGDPNYDQKKFKTFIDLVTPKASASKTAVKGPKGGKDFRSFLKS